jgi:rfaE bifunctional protein nucleotidyltransferase chain/domain
MKNQLSFECEEFIKECRSKGDRLVFTNGCFDILHSGHVTYLREAKKLGDKLIVGLNSDKSVRQLKGPTRPINEQLDRRMILSELRSVDFVEIFDEETPLELIKNIKPNLLVKGGDYKIHEIAGSDFVQSYGGKVIILGFVPDKSTSAIINRAQQ